LYILPPIPKIYKSNKVEVSLFPATYCTSIVLFNSKLCSTLGLPKLTKFIRDSTYLNTESLSVFVGILLGDACFNSSKANTNVIIKFKQSIINLPYMFEVFT